MLLFQLACIQCPSHLCPALTYHLINPAIPLNPTSHPISQSYYIPVLPFLSILHSSLFPLVSNLHPVPPIPDNPIQYTSHATHSSQSFIPCNSFISNLHPMQLIPLNLSSHATHSSQTFIPAHPFLTNLHPTSLPIYSLQLYNYILAHPFLSILHPNTPIPLKPSSQPTHSSHTFTLAHPFLPNLHPSKPIPFSFTSTPHLFLSILHHTQLNPLTPSS